MAAKYEAFVELLAKRVMMTRKREKKQKPSPLREDNYTQGIADEELWRSLGWIQQQVEADRAN